MVTREIEIEGRGRPVKPNPISPEVDNRIRIGHDRINLTKIGDY